MLLPNETQILMLLLSYVLLAVREVSNFLFPWRQTGWADRKEISITINHIRHVCLCPLGLFVGTYMDSFNNSSLRAKRERDDGKEHQIKMKHGIRISSNSIYNVIRY